MNGLKTDPDYASANFTLEWPAPGVAVPYNYMGFAVVWKTQSDGQYEFDRDNRVLVSYWHIHC